MQSLVCMCSHCNRSIHANNMQALLSHCTHRVARTMRLKPEPEAWPARAMCKTNLTSASSQKGVRSARQVFQRGHHGLPSLCSDAITRCLDAVAAAQHPAVHRSLFASFAETVYHGSIRGAHCKHWSGGLPAPDNPQWTSAAQATHITRWEAASAYGMTTVSGRPSARRQCGGG